MTASASDNVGISKVEFYVNGALQATDTASPYTFSWNTSSVANGSYTLSAKAYNAAKNIGQSSTVTVTVNNTDISAPTVSITSPKADATVNGTVTITADASDDSKLSNVKFYINNVLKRTVKSAPYSYKWVTTGVSDGSYTLTAKGYDTTGKMGNSSTVTVSLKNDSKAPKVTIISPIGNKPVGGKKTVTARVSDKRGVKKVEFYVDGELQATDTASPWSFKWNTVSLTNTAAHTLSAKAYDASGNIGESLPVSVTVFNDKIVPTVSITLPTDDAIVSGNVKVKAGASDNVKVSKTEFYVNNVLKHTDSTASYSYNWVTTALPNGSYTLTVKTYDSAGNVGQSSVAVKVGN